MTLAAAAGALEARVAALEALPPGAPLLPFKVLSPSGGDDAPAINAALTAHCFVWLTPGTFDIAGEITVPANARLVGSGAKLTTLRKSADCDGVRLLMSAAASDLYIDGNYKAGRGFVLPAGEHYQRLERVGAWTAGPCIHFDGNGAGSHAWVEHVSATRSALTDYAIVLPDHDLANGIGGGNRHIIHFNSHGGCGVDLNGAANTHVMFGNFVNVRMNAYAAGCRLLFNRIAGNTRNVLLGWGHFIDGNFVSGGWQLGTGCQTCTVIQVNQGGAVPPVLNDGSAGPGNVVWQV